MLFEEGIIITGESISKERYIRLIHKEETLNKLLCIAIESMEKRSFKLSEFDRRYIAAAKAIREVIEREG